MLPIFWYFGPRRNQNESRNILTPKSAARHPVGAREQLHFEVGRIRDQDRPCGHPLAELVDPGVVEGPERPEHEV